MDTSQEQFRGHKPELVPRRLIRTGLVHHPAVLDEARDETEPSNFDSQTGSPRSPVR